MRSDADTPDFIRAQGMAFLAHLLRRLSDRMVADAGAFFRREGIRAPPRTASTLLLLDEQGSRSVTQLAQQLRQSHPLVITWIRQLTRLGFVAVAADPDDGRRTLVTLTAAGREEAGRMAAAVARLGRAYAALLSKAGADIVDPLWRLADGLAAGELEAELSLAAAADGST